jgi:putative copper resistance protein D
VLDAALVALRWVQFWAAMILFGSSLFLVPARATADGGPRPALAWPRRLLTFNAAALLIASPAALVIQTSILAGSLGDGIQPQSLWAAISTTSFGPSTLVRAAAAAIALLALTWKGLTRSTRILVATFGALATASIAWMGHGAATEGPMRAVHLVSDILHALAAGVWVGALAAFFGSLQRRTADPALDRELHRSLHGFGGVGSAVVAVIVATGLVNSWFLVGPDHLDGLTTTLWGQLLLAKLGLFLAMLGFAAVNRFRLTPRLEAALADDPAVALAALRRSVTWETVVALTVLALVAVLGMQPPPASG